MMYEELKYWVWMSSLLQISPRKRIELIEYFGKPQYIWYAKENELRKIPFITKGILKELIDPKYKDNTCRLIEKIYKEDIRMLRYNYDDAYPKILYNIYDPPLVLYVKGNYVNAEMAIAVVGSRRATAYGLKTAESISSKLSSCGITIVSGMARGIDSYAHIGALKSGGRTIAVLGCGVDIVYPSENRKLMKQIVETGAVISEYPPGTPPFGYNFPARNRIISGLCQGVVIIEAAHKSGSLITADFALEQGREVFAVPGNINNINSSGTNKLIKEGAKLVSSVDDILEELNNFNLSKMSEHIITNKNDKNILCGLSIEEKRILQELIYEPLHIDMIKEKCNMSIQKINSLLIMMELKGVIEQVPGNIYYIRQ
jgi:DNA processing protein